MVLAPISYMETTQNKPMHINQHEETAHKLMLIGKVLRLGPEKAREHLYGKDLAFLKEIEHKNLEKVKEELLKEMLYD